MSIEYINSFFLAILYFLKAEIGQITLALVVILIFSKSLSFAVKKYVQDDKKRYGLIKWIRYFTGIIFFIWMLIIYNAHISGKNSFVYLLIGTFLAGIAISMRDVFSNIVGWVLIISSKGYKSGDRIKIGEISGDVIDIGVYRTIIAEIGDWIGADQSTGRLVSIPNSAVLTKEIINFTRGFDLIWNETKILVTFESDWEKAENIITKIAMDDFEQKKESITKKLFEARKKMMLQYNYISPKVYVTISDSGVELKLRYMVRARRRRTLEDIISRKILREFAKESSIEFAYPTVRVFKNGE